VRYDAAIIGAGANGLTAAAVLARAGLKTLVIERAGRAGGPACHRPVSSRLRGFGLRYRVPEIPAAVAAALGSPRCLEIEHLPSDSPAAP